MISLNPAICLLHEAYNRAMGLDLPMTPPWERLYWSAIQIGLTPELLEIAVRERMKLNLTSQFKMKLGIYNLIGTDDDTARIINEAAIVLSRRRVKVMDPGKASVLRATGRPDTVTQGEPVKAGDLKLIEDLRKAAGP